MVVIGEAIGSAIVVELSPAAGLHEYKNTGSPTPVAVIDTDAPSQIVTPPPTMPTVGSASVIPVKVDVCPSVSAAPAAIRVFAPRGALNFTQGFEAWLKTPFNWAASIIPSTPVISALG